MSVMIKGMEMPKSCWYCQFSKKVDPETIKCLVTEKRFEETFLGTISARDESCPLVDMPSAEPQTEINMAYMRGKIDGINYCTERLREMRMEVDNDV